MMTFLKTLTATTILLGTTAFSANATINPIENQTRYASKSFLSANYSDTNAIKTQSAIGVARLSKGRLISTPLREQADWDNLSSQNAIAYQPISVGGYLNNVPAIDLNSTDTTNKIDEIRLTARDQGLDYVIVYGFGADANWAGIGGQSLNETGLEVPAGTPAWQRGEGKALLINTYTGKVVGSAITGFDEVEPGAEILARRMSAMIGS